MRPGAGVTTTSEDAKIQADDRRRSSDSVKKQSENSSPKYMMQ